MPIERIPCYRVGYSLKSLVSEFYFYGSTGYLGSRIRVELERSFEVITGRARLENSADVDRELRVADLWAVVCCVGVGGIPSATWHDDNKAVSTRFNFIGPLSLASACSQRSLLCLLLGSGVVQSETTRPVLETEGLNPPPSFYGRLRARLEEALEPFWRDVLLIRIMYPVTGDGDPRCLLSKLSKATTVHTTPTSITVLPTLLPLLTALIERRCTGPVNFVNDGVVSPHEICTAILGMSQLSTCSFDPRTAACNMSVATLQKLSGLPVPLVRDALRSTRQ